MGEPLIQKKPTNGQFKLTIGAQKTTNLDLPYLDVSMNGPGASTLIDGQGVLEFQFSVPDNAKFFRVQSR